MSHGKHFTLYSHKVVLLLEELGLSYETIFLDFQKGEQKHETHVKHNPNGNSDFTLWESNAILEYLAYTYDKEGKVSVTKPEDKYIQLQWLFFQASGQGPYFGQASWFKNYHSEKIPSAIERYQNEIKRVFGVLESVLSKQEWLVGGKFTIADLSFVSWTNYGAKGLLDNFDLAKEYPALDKWIKKITERPAIKKVLTEYEAANKK